MKKLILIAIISSSTLFSSFGAVPNISKLREKVSQQSLEISELAAKVRTVDKKISQTNDEYLEKMRRIESLEASASELRARLNKSKSKISHEYRLVKKAMDLYLLEMSSSEGDTGFSQPKIYLEVLQTKMVDLKRAQESSSLLLSSLNQYEQNLQSTRKVEETLYQVIADLESRKKMIGENYISLMEDHNVKQELLDKELAKRKARSKVYAKARIKAKDLGSAISVNLSMPIANFSGMKKGKKGITFKYDEIVPLKAPAGGKVSYAGDLASYGKVIMIDHGHNIRSVFLGDIALKVKKETVLKRGDIVGYTIADPGLQKTLYYEIRKKNVAQDTYSWLAKNNKNLKI